MAVILQLGAGELMRHSIRQIQALGHQVFAVDKNSPMHQLLILLMALRQLI